MIIDFILWAYKTQNLNRLSIMSAACYNAGRSEIYVFSAATEVANTVPMQRISRTCNLCNHPAKTKPELVESFGEPSHYPWKSACWYLSCGVFAFFGTKYHLSSKVGRENSSSSPFSKVGMASFAIVSSWFTM
ncbi:hypothetical protein SeMB42_g02871 [Synchytrium endobioticum]|uniref:Uncharacterized protein n=1 Tax=Synchytrium endobioticum TaxID=286115 RepID=A0A507DBH0_9FUNG|nr:hypothetical protein SeMB42_g02871 [Synchytrium endobioticum]